MHPVAHAFSACNAMRDRDTLIVQQLTTLIEQSQLHFLSVTFSCMQLYLQKLKLSLKHKNFGGKAPPMQSP